MPQVALVRIELAPTRHGCWAHAVAPGGRRRASLWRPSASWAHRAIGAVIDASPHLSGIGRANIVHAEVPLQISRRTARRIRFGIGLARAVYRGTEPTPDWPGWQKGRVPLEQLAYYRQRRALAWHEAVKAEGR